MKPGFLGPAVVLALIAMTIGVYRYQYPFGQRRCALACMCSSLLSYAMEHNGRFPYSENGPHAALEKLYPDFAPSGRELAGISGNIRSVKLALEKKLGLGTNLTSWVYHQGLTINDHGTIAILWESRAGLYANGRRNSFGGRAVLLIDGTITNVSENDWPSFIRKQARLRKSVLLDGSDAER